MLRLEDTDRTRYEAGSVENLMDALYTTGVVPDEGLMLEDGKPVQKGDCGPYIQSERLPIYQKYIRQLLDEGKAYYCFCTKERLDDLRKKQKWDWPRPRAGPPPRRAGRGRHPDATSWGGPDDTPGK